VVKQYRDPKYFAATSWSELNWWARRGKGVNKFSSSGKRKLQAENNNEKSGPDNNNEKSEKAPLSDSLTVATGAEGAAAGVGAAAAAPGAAAGSGAAPASGAPPASGAGGAAEAAVEEGGNSVRGLANTDTGENTGETTMDDPFSVPDYRSSRLVFEEQGARTEGRAKQFRDSGKDKYEPHPDWLQTLWPPEVTKAGGGDSKTSTDTNSNGMPTASSLSPSLNHRILNRLAQTTAYCAVKVKRACRETTEKVRLAAGRDAAGKRNMMRAFHCDSETGS
jgi:hypothetical protein